MSSNLLTALNQADANPKSGWHQNILFYNTSSDDESVDSTTTSPIKEHNTDIVKANTSSESIEEDVLLVDETVSLKETQDDGAKHNSSCLSDLHRNPTELRVSSFGRIPKIFTSITSLKNMNSVDDTPMENISPPNVGRGIGRGANRGSVRARGKSRGRILRGNVTGLNLSRSNLPDVSKKSIMQLIPCDSTSCSTNEDVPALNGRIWKHADVLNRDKLTRPPLHPDFGDQDNKDSYVNKNNSLRLPIRHPDTSTKDSGEQTLFIVVTTSQVNTCDALPISLSGHSRNSSTTQEEIHQMEHKMALCPYCGAQSTNFQKCDVCHEALPAQIKTSLSSNETQSNKRPAFTGYFDQRTFYDDKFEQYSEFFANNEDDDDDEVSFNKDKVLATCSERIRNSWIKANEEARSRKFKGNPIIEPPVCLTISSDEEESNEQQITQRMQTEDIPQPTEFNSPNLKVEEQHTDNQKRQSQEMEETPTRRDKMRDKIEEKSQFMDMAESIKDGSIITCQNNLKVCNMKEKRLANFLITDAVDKEVELICRSVRIGSYKTAQDQPITFNCQGITIYVKGIESLDLVKVQISASDIVMVLASFCKHMPCLFIYVTPKSGLVVRERLKMNSKKGPYFDPKSAEECHKRIVVLPDQITNEQGYELRAIFDDIFKAEKRSVVILHEIESSRANILLVKSKPPDLPGSPSSPMCRSNLIISNIGLPIPNQADKSSLVLRTSPSPFNKNITKLLVYPPPPQTGGITITSEDFACLEDGEFLNDVIIDFYLKYLVLHKLSEEDRNRTHLLSSFFYRRLTQKPARQYNSFEDDPSLTAQQKRHTRVKTWTRHVDLFEKDFIIVPINESAHWFLAIICYPGLFEPVYDDKPDTADSNKTQSEESPQESQSQPTEQEDEDDEEEEEEEEDEEEYEAAAASTENDEVPMDTSALPDMITQAEEAVTSSTEALPPTPVNVTTPVKPAVPNPRWQRPGCKKQPCILIFDSLAGPGRALIVKALREYLNVEWDLKKKVARVFNKDTLKGANPKVPQQNNYSDCGVYLLQYAETFFEIPIKDYATPIKGLQTWFSLDRVMSKRSEIQQLILRLQREQLESLQEKAQRTTS